MAEDVCLVCKTGCYYLGMDMLKGVEGVAFCQHLECWVVKYGAFGFHENQQNSGLVSKKIYYIK